MQVLGHRRRDFTVDDHIAQDLFCREAHDGSTVRLQKQDGLVRFQQDTSDTQVVAIVRFDVCRGNWYGFHGIYLSSKGWMLEAGELLSRADSLASLYDNIVDNRTT